MLTSMLRRTSPSAMNCCQTEESLRSKCSSYLLDLAPKCVAHACMTLSARHVTAGWQRWGLNTAREAHEDLLQEMVRK